MSGKELMVLFINSTTSVAKKRSLFFPVEKVSKVFRTFTTNMERGSLMAKVSMSDTRQENISSATRLRGRKST
jgi:hypothetical protein